MRVFDRRYIWVLRLVGVVRYFLKAKLILSLTDFFQFLIRLILNFLLQVFNLVKRGSRPWTTTSPRASNIKYNIDSVACNYSQSGRTKIHLCCDFKLVLHIYIVITYRYFLFIMVCVISLYLSECARPNKKSSLSGTACKKKNLFQVLQVFICELDKG